MKKLCNLGKLPLANNLLTNKNDKVKKYPLVVGFDKKTKLVGLMSNAPAEEMFNETYVYDSSQSQTMVNHFKEIAEKSLEKFKPKSVLEIGSNSGIFIKNFKDKDIEVLAVEPCKNFADKTSEEGIDTICAYWDDVLAESILKGYPDYGYPTFDLIFSSNTISHIHDLDSCFKGIKRCLSHGGTFILESPSLLEIIKNNIIDQFYHEHQSYFSIISLNQILIKYGLIIYDVEDIKVHGGSNRYYICHVNNYAQKDVSENLAKLVTKELEYGLDDYKKLKRAFENMLYNLDNLKKQIINLKQDGYNIIGYGATAKISLILNILKLDSKYITYILDTTPEKQNKFIPGIKVKILPYSKLNLNISNVCLLGAWNFKKEILAKEKEYLENGGVFITHIPITSIIDKDTILSK